MSKEKYQEALNRLRNTTRKGWESKNDEKAILTLQELVGKATPKKIVYREFMKITPGHEYKESCPNCNSVFDYEELGKKHCSNCGQAIDWSEE